GLFPAHESSEIFLCRSRERRAREELRPVTRAAAETSGRSHDETIAAEAFLVEPDAVAELELGIDAVIRRDLFLEPLDIDSKGPEQPHGLGTVLARPLDVKGAAVQQQRASPAQDPVALRVPAEVVVVVEDEDAGLRTRGGAEEMRGGQAADPAADNDEIVDLAGVLGRLRPRMPVAKLMA